MLEIGLQKPLHAFRAYRPSDWARAKSMTAKTVVYRRPRRPRGLDLFKFIEAGISATRGGENVDTSPSHATGRTTARVLTTIRRNAAGQTTQLRIEKPSTSFYSAVARVQPSSKSTLLISPAQQMRSPGSTRTWFGSHRVSSIRTAGPLPVMPQIDVRFTPTREQQQRIDLLAGALQEAGLGNLLAFENDLGDLVIEAGPPARTLTLISRPAKTLAIYRTAAGEDFDVRTEKFETPPPRAEILKIAHEYTTTWRNPRT
jgi:hypothetical protein